MNTTSSLPSAPAGAVYIGTHRQLADAADPTSRRGDGTPAGGVRAGARGPIRVDPNTRTVRAQPGLTWGEFDRETQAFGLAATGGAVSRAGIAGLTLGGGIGWLQRKHGLTCDNLISADVVAADGRLS